MQRQSPNHARDDLRLFSKHTRCLPSECTPFPVRLALACGSGQSDFASHLAIEIQMIRQLGFLKKVSLARVESHRYRRSESREITTEPFYLQRCLYYDLY